MTEATGTDVRSIREWLEQQATAGFVEVADAAAAWNDRRYFLTDAQAAVLVDETDPRHVSPLADMLAGVGQVIDQVVESHRIGSGVRFSAYGSALREGQGAINRPAFTHDLVPSWIGAVDGLLDRLADGGRIADLGCGVGWSTIAMATQIPGSTVTGWDLDHASIEEARRLATAAGAEVRFEAADAAAMAAEGPFELVTILEALHDMADPAAVLSSARASLAPDGVLLIADELVANTFASPGDEMDRLMYGWSVTHCLPAALADGGPEALGTVLRTPTVLDLAAAAGFASVETPAVDAGFFRLYILRS